MDPLTTLTSTPLPAPLVELFATDPGRADRFTVAAGDLRIDYSKKTRFTKGTLKTNLKRFDTRNTLRIVGRALTRKLFGTEE